MLLLLGWHWLSSVLDPHCFYADPNSAFHVIMSMLIPMWIRIQVLEENSLKKLQLLKRFIFFEQKLAIYLSLGLDKWCPSYSRSLKPSKNIQHEISNFFYFCGSLWPSWIQIQSIWPKSMRIHADSDPDLDSKLCPKVSKQNITNPSDWGSF